MKIIVETNRLILKVFEPKDADEVKNYWGNNEVMVHCAGATPLQLIPKVIDSYIKCQKDNGLSVYAVVEKASGTVIGAAGFNVTDSLHSVELIYHFAKESWGKGYATEAAEACLSIARANGKVKTVFASVDPKNTNSLKILEKIDFTYQGIKWFDDTEQEEPYYKITLD